ncbi:MAG: Nif11-like leader peptide family natural product precursor [Halioglobus sp.]|nr:Nif11-like leader peptide family natural product precursor [Halioglobus sp.]
MTVEAVVQFLEATSQDKSLREGLAGIMGVGDGDVSSVEELDQEEAQALLGHRSVLVATFAEQHGYAFSVAELNAVVGVYQRYKAGELSKTAFSMALGLDSGSVPDASQLEGIGHSVGLVYRGIEYKAEKKAGSSSQVLDFMKKTAEDPGFREKLKEILNTGDGDISDVSQLDADEMEALTGARGALVAEFAAAHGFLFTMSDLLAVTDAFARVQSKQISSDEFARFLDLDVKSKDFFPFIENVVSMTYKGVNYSAPVAAKSKDNTLPVIRFMERSGSDPALRQKLMAILGGDGDISNPTQLDAQEAQGLSGDSSGKVVRLGAEYGYRFTASDLGAVVGAFQLVGKGQLPLESCARILGLGKSDSAIASVKKTSGLVYRGVRS